MTRHYDSSTLRVFAEALDEGQQELLVLAGALPADPFANLEPMLSSEDTAELIGIVEEMKE